MFINNRKLANLLIKTLKFPDSKVCKHYVVADVLSLLEESGIPISSELAKAVIESDDENAIAILKQSDIFSS